jgi:hypothetical protein
MSAAPITVLIVTAAVHYLPTRALFRTPIAIAIAPIILPKQLKPSEKLSRSKGYCQSLDNIKKLAHYLQQ